jgi:addiction module HigA family antidote
LEHKTPTADGLSDEITASCGEVNDLTGRLCGEALPARPITIKEENLARTAIHPGEHLGEELRELGMSAAELARQVGVPVNRVTGIINSERGVTADTALRHWSISRLALNEPTLSPRERALRFTHAESYFPASPASANSLQLRPSLLREFHGLNQH